MNLRNFFSSLESWKNQFEVWIRRLLVKTDWYTRLIYLSLCLVLILAIIVFITDLISQWDSVGHICTSSECVQNFLKFFPASSLIIKEGVSIMAFVAAVVGSVIALQTYRVSVKSSALSGHIGHLKLFQEYVMSECLKYGVNYVDSVDVFLWYRIMFPASKIGNVKISKNYIDLINELKSELDKSDFSLKTPNKFEKYTFTNSDHQRRIIEAMEKLGINISRNEQKYFNVLETSILRVIDSVNSTFADSGESLRKLPILNKIRSYQ